ncbi:hypothetical protein [Thalassospira sp.]|uniref:hypothetical protein n=1 Tax=Thalassospira sp. TaxID=1912094 RepID=UPI000C697D03|nr:hypothetical protein [Thalassospira sp.]MBC05681.1 hypothetical protein [Thalassospira sp.]|tara:strand:- start:1406 stop:2215 length:810 start_codon:yes stop_codon:yes gene_type:complete
MSVPTNSRTLSAADLDSTDTKEPRIQDERLGERLGLSRPRDIRKLIDRNRAELEGFGPLAPRWRKSRGQDFEEYWLNEAQALLVCTFARTDRAAEVRRELIMVFLAWRRGSLPTRLPRWTPTRGEMRDINSRASQILQTRFGAVRDALVAQIRADRLAGHIRPLSDYAIEPTTLLPSNDPGLPKLDDGQALFCIEGRMVLTDITDARPKPGSEVIAIAVADDTGPARFAIESTPPAPNWFDRCFLARPTDPRDLVRPVVVVIGTVIEEG